MPRILPEIATLTQHLDTFYSDPERYRPDACPCCNLARPWAHGFYTRKADRPPSGQGQLNPIPIPRFLCPHCRRTCSRLPECIPPRRWYLWVVQQAVLCRALSEWSIRLIHQTSGPARSTIRRWRDWLEARGMTFAFHLKSHFPQLGRFEEGTAFWQAVFERPGLAGAMAVLDRLGEIVP